MKIHIGVLFGGRSVEHEVSVISGLQTVNAINTEQFDVSPIYLSKEGDWYIGEALFEISNYKDVDALKKQCKLVIPSGEKGCLKLSGSSSGWFAKNSITKFDVIFPVTHGTYGEDGCLQGLLEMYDVPYVGCDVTASALGMDKIRFKEIGLARNLPMVDYLWFFSKAWYKDPAPIRQQVVDEIGYPLIVKPVDLGSSIGVSVVNTEEDLDEAIILATSFANRVIVETFVPNLMEINCSVIGDLDETVASACEEPLHSSEFLSYAEKYQSDGEGTKGMESSKRKLPADISQELTLEIQTLAKKTFLAIEANGVARIDFLINRVSGDVFVNEINTIPGSLSFYLWTVTNLEFSDLIAKLIKLALKRSRERSALLRTNSVNILAMSSKGGGKL